MNETLIAPKPVAPPIVGQALLFSPEIEKLVAREEQSTGVYTGERFKARRPHDYQAVIELLGRGKGMMAIAKLLGCHHKTVAAVRDAEPESIDMIRSKRVNRIMTAVDLQIERLIESPGLVPMNVAGLLISQLIDKAELLDGRATQRVEKVERVDIYQQYAEVLEKYLEPGDVREIGPETGLGDGKVLAIEAAAAGPRDLADHDDIDAESADLSGVTKERSETDTALPTIERPNETPTGPDLRTNQNQGGRGSELPTGHGQTQLGYSKRNFSGNAPLPPPPI